MSKTSFFQWATVVIGIAAVGVAIYFGLRGESDTPNVNASDNAVVSTGSGNAVSTGDNSSVNIGGTQTNQSSNND